MLSRGIPWNMPLVTCIFFVYIIAFIPCLNLRKTYGNFGKSSEISVNFLKLRKRYKPVFEELKRFMKLLQNFGNSSKVFWRARFLKTSISANPGLNSLTQDQNLAHD